MLTFEWSWANNYGRGVFKSNNDGVAFSGTWGYRESTDNGRPGTAAAPIDNT